MTQSVKPLRPIGKTEAKRLKEDFEKYGICCVCQTRQDVNRDGALEMHLNAVNEWCGWRKSATTALAEGLDFQVENKSASPRIGHP